MKAATWYAKGDVRVEEVADPPSPKTDWVKVKVDVCGICGSDLHEYSAGPILIFPDTPHPVTGISSPVILGHEFSGEVVECGDGVTHVASGDKVVVLPGITCGTCTFCQKGDVHLCDSLAAFGLHADGAFAEYINVPALSLFRMPEAVTGRDGAVVEPFAVSLHAVRQGQIKPSDCVLILGAGVIGLGAVQAAVALGAEKVYVVEIMPARKELALKLGATQIIDPVTENVVEKIHSLTGGLGADVVIECIGHESTGPLAVTLTRKAGRTVLVGIFEKACSVDFLDVVCAEKTIIGSFGYTVADFGDAIKFMSEGKFDARSLVTKIIKLDDIVSQGFEELIENKDKHIKILVKP